MLTEGATGPLLQTLPISRKINMPIVKGGNSKQILESFQAQWSLCFCDECILIIGILCYFVK